MTSWLLLGYLNIFFEILSSLYALGLHVCVPRGLAMRFASILTQQLLSLNPEINLDSVHLEVYFHNNCRFSLRQAAARGVASRVCDPLPLTKFKKKYIRIFPC